MPYFDWIYMCKGDLAILGAVGCIDVKSSLARTNHRYKLRSCKYQGRTPVHKVHHVRRLVRVAYPVRGIYWKRRKLRICSLPALSCLQPMTNLSSHRLLKSYICEPGAHSRSTLFLNSQSTLNNCFFSARDFKSLHRK